MENMWSQEETLKNIQRYMAKHYTVNTKETTKLPFYNTFPYKPSKETIARLKGGVCNIVIVPTQDK